jgi:5-methylcytosine-specific restriction protein A
VGKGDDKDLEVIRLSHELSRLPFNLDCPDPDRFRNPNGVAMKLANFAARDAANAGEPAGGASQAIPQGQVR